MRWMVAFLGFMILLTACPVLADTVDTAVPALSVSVPQPQYAVEPVSVNEFTEKINHLLQLAIGITSGILVQVAIFSIMICCIVLALGWLLRADVIRRVGLNGIVLSAFGLLVFWSIPFILRVLSAVAKVLNS